MITEIASGGTASRATTSDITVGGGVTTELVTRLSAYYVAGYVGVVYYEGLAALVDSIVRQLDTNGYKVVRKVLADNTPADIAVATEISMLPEEVRFLLIIGDSGLISAAKLDGRRYGAVLIGAAQPALLTRRASIEGQPFYKSGVAPTFVIADLQASYHYSSDSMLACTYGCIMAMPLSCINHDLQSAISRNNDIDIYSAIALQTEAILTTSYSRNSRSWHDEFVTQSLQLALYVSMLGESLDYNDSIARVLGDCLNGDTRGGELSGYAAWYMLNKLNKIGTKLLDNCMSFPCDTAAAIDKLCGMAIYDSTEVISNIHLYSIDELMRIDFILREYYPEWVSKLSLFASTLDKAIVTLKRMHSDAGRNLAAELSGLNINDIMLPASLVCEEYSLVKHLYLMGYIN